MNRILREWVRYPLEAAAVVVLYALFVPIPAAVASTIGGALGRTLGPLLPVTRRAYQNLARAMPETNPAERRRIVHAMWDNLGRIGAEYPHIRAISRNAGAGGRIEIVGAENLDSLREPGTPGILFSGHFANWELFSRAVAACGIDYAQVYRPPNNPLVRRLTHLVRPLPNDKQIPKGAEGARKAIGVLRAGGEIGLLVDQKLNDGIAVPFFGIEAMTAPSVAQLGLRFDCPVIPARLERTGGCRFRITFLPPIERPETGNRREDVRLMMTRVNELFESWIRERPEQWLWLHRRWPD